MKKYLAVKAVAERYSIGVSTVWYLVQHGKLPKPYKINVNTTRWLASELDEWDANLEQLTPENSSQKAAVVNKRWEKK